VCRRGLLLAVVLLAAAILGEPSPAGSQGPDYRIGIDDVLVISVLDQKDLEQVVFVRPDGRISLQLIGEVQAGGLTVNELAARLTELYARTVRNAQVTVGIKQINSRPVFFLGGVVKPGPMQLTQDLTLLQALSAVGGPNPNADLESAYIMRGNSRIPVDIQRMLQRGDTAQNIKLQPGDTVVIPNADAVFVQGEVKTPGQIKYVKDLTIVKAIAVAGGFTPLASPGRVTVTRSEGPKRETFRVDVGEIMRNPGEAKDVPLRPNDIVVVPQRLF
jgi:polysaccharide export outer membrane protein